MNAPAANPAPGGSLFAVLFTDLPGQGALRAQHLAAHIQWVDAHRAQVLVAGSLREAPGDTPHGGLWVVRAASKAAVHRLMASDPFWTCGLRERVDVWHWSKALEHHQALV